MKITQPKGNPTYLLAAVNTHHTLESRTLGKDPKHPLLQADVIARPAEKRAADAPEPSEAERQKEVEADLNNRKLVRVATLGEFLENSNFVEEIEPEFRQKAIDIVQSGLAANPDVTAIVSHAASMSDGIASFLKQKGLKDITHISSDGDDEMFTYFGTPYLTADRYYSSAQTGVIATEAVRAKLEGKTFPFATSIDQVMITADTYKAELAKNPYNYPQYKAQVAKL